jgi:sugar phosphate isomerase/epimerase
MKHFSRRARRCAATAATGVAVLAGAAAADAQTRPEKVGDGIPTGQMSVQMFNYGGFISGGTGTGSAFPITNVSAACIAPVPTPNPNPANNAACQRERLEALVAFLQRKGLTNLELFAHAQFPAQNDIPGLRAYRALLDKYGLHAAGWHGTVTDVGPAWTERVAAAKILGLDYIGSGGTASPGIRATAALPDGYANTLATAAALNRLGKESVESGVGPVYIHNHTDEFDYKYMDNGVMKSAWQILMDRTDAKYVQAEVDVFWSSDAFNDVTGTQTAALINANPTRVKMLHIKDGVNVAANGATPPSTRAGSPRATGTGEVDFRPIFAAAKNKSQYYHQEHDGGTITDADISFTNLKGVGTSVVPAVLGLPTTFQSVAAGTSAATNVTPIQIWNTGDAPLTITGASITGDNAGDFAIINHNCSTLAPGNLLATPPVPRGTCTVNVGFKPTMTNMKSVAYLTLTSNADDATERILLTGMSTGQATGPVGGTVGSQLALTLAGSPSFGAFTPGVTRTYEATAAATVVSTGADATLSVTDTSTNATGRLVNGAYALPQPLQVRATNAASPNSAFAPLSTTAGTPVNLLTWNAPSMGSEAVTIGMRQAIASTDVLRTGAYSKTLTFTLSTTTP